MVLHPLVRLISYVGKVLPILVLLTSGKLFTYTNYTRGVNSLPLHYGSAGKHKSVLPSNSLS